MFTVQQLQALDYLLKRITSNEHYLLFGKDLKLVIETRNSFLYGDFIRMDRSQAYEFFITDDGNIERDHLYAYGNKATNLLKKIWDSYISLVKRQSPFWNDPFTHMENSPILLDTLIKILEQSDISDEPSPFYPCLLNAKSIDGEIKLPYVYLGNEEKIKLISIIEVER